MSEREHHGERQEDSPVGDVRQVREQLSERFGNDVRRLGEYARRIGEQARIELGSELVRKTSERAPSSVTR